MKRGIYVFIVSTLLIVGAAYAATAGIVLSDPLDGSTLGTPSGITYGPGESGQAAIFDANTDNILYAKDLFPLKGTISVLVKRSAFWGVIDTVGGSPSPLHGDLQLAILNDGTPRFTMRNGGWNRLSGTSVIGPNNWTLLAISYGDNGMKLYVNGVQEGTFTQGSNYFGARADDAVYAGDFGGDSGGTGLVGSLDLIRTSTIESDPSLLHVPEPGSFVALLGGLIPSIALFRRRSS